MNDRELLEMAAKAAGFVAEWREWTTGRVAEFKTIKYTKHEGHWVNGVPWNPLTYDGDALRLAVRLGMNLSTNLHHRFVTVNDEQEFYDEAKFGGVCDPDGVMRRTIVRAAAEIGRQMQEGGAT